MTNMSPFQIVVFSVFGLLAFVGIFVFATYSGLGGTSSLGPVEVWGTLPEDPMVDAIATIKENNEEFGAITYTQLRGETFSSELADAISAGQGPDLIIITQEQLLTELPRIESIPFSSIPQRTYLDTYVPITQLFLNQGGTYAIPFVVDPLVLYYNTATLSSIGAAQAPKTWEAVTGIVPATTQLSPNQSVERSGLAFGSYANVMNARAIMSLLFLQTGSSISAPVNGQMQATLSGSASTVGSTGNTGPEAALNFYTQFANPSRTVYSWNPSMPSSRQAFLSGDLTLYIGYASEYASLRAGNPNLSFDMAPVPQSATATGRATYGLAYAFAIPKMAENKAGAYEVALSLSDAAVLPNIAEAVGMAPAKRALLVPDPSDLYAAVYYPEALSAKGWLSPAPATVDQIFSAMISNVTSGRDSTPEALSAADQSLNAAF